jgi:hypothetical protein
MTDTVSSETLYAALLGQGPHVSSTTLYAAILSARIDVSSQTLYVAMLDPLAGGSARRRQMSVVMM